MTCGLHGCQRLLLPACLQASESSGVATYDLFRRSHPITQAKAAEPAEPGVEARSALLRSALAAFAVLADFFPESLDELQRVALLTSLRDVPRLPGISSSTFQRMSFVLASPLEAYELNTEADRLYAHALFALKDRALGIIQSGSASGVRGLLQAANDHRRHLVQDMRNGHVAAATPVWTALLAGSFQCRVHSFRLPLNLKPYR